MKVAVGLGLIYFLLGVLTLPRYGINWDTINHLPRGQAYLHYFLTGSHDYSDLPEWKKYYQNPRSLGVDADVGNENLTGRSMYQLDATTFDYYMEHDGDGHPPLSDILSSVFNRVLFGQLRLINDIDAYRVYGVFLAAALVGLTYYWMASVYGGFSGIVAALALATYPLFWSESHFNTEKDIPETVYWSALMYCVWRGISDKKPKWILLSGVFFGLALGTKFNILFAILVVGPWLLWVYGGEYLGLKKKNLRKFIGEKKKLLVAGVLAPVIGFMIFVATWPFLWVDSVNSLMGVIGFYKTIGVTTNIDPRFVGRWKINTYPIKWILYTTHPMVLVLAGVGVLVAIYLFVVKKEKNSAALMFLLWFMVPIMRVISPKATIYGGIRQIMEYVPAMALLAGLGGWFLWKYIKENNVLGGMVLFLMFIPIFVRMVSIFPNENVYFNFLVGGLSGAKAQEMPAWGNSFGAAYRDGVAWINENAEKDARVVYAFELIPNVPSIFWRQDLSVWNKQRSGYLRLGEYAITLTSQGTESRSYYDMYLNRFLDPVYETKVDGVSILKVWQNDEAHLKRSVDEELVSAALEKTDSGIRFELSEPRNLSRLELKYLEKNCNPALGIYVQISMDGKNWARLPGSLPNDWLIPEIGQQPMDGGFIEPFVGQKAKYIEIVMNPVDACLSQVLTSEMFVFKESQR